MSHHNKIPPAPVIIQSAPPELGYFDRSKEFLSKPETVTYIGRTVVVITAVVLIYLAYRNRKKICSTIGTIKDKFKEKCCRCFEKNKIDARSPRGSLSDPSGSQSPVTTFNINIKDPLKLTIRHVNDDEGKNDSSPKPPADSTSPEGSVRKTQTETPASV